MRGLGSSLVAKDRGTQVDAAAAARAWKRKRTAMLFMRTRFCCLESLKEASVYKLSASTKQLRALGLGPRGADGLCA